MIPFDLNAAFWRFFHDSGFENFQFAKARHAELVTPKIRVISSSESLFNKISWVIILSFLQEALGDWLAQLCLITFCYMVGFRREWTLRCRNDIFWRRFLRPFPCDWQNIARGRPRNLCENANLFYSRDGLKNVVKRLL